MSNEVLNRALAHRRDRSIAIILGVKERECDDYLPSEVSRKLRKAVLDQVNEFHDFCLDILRSYDDGSGVILNEDYMDRLDEVHEVMTEVLVEMAAQRK